MMQNPVGIDLKDPDVAELVFLLFQRKFRSGDSLAQMSTILNDVLRQCLAEHGQLSNAYEAHRAEVVDAFKAACAPDVDPNLWAFLQSQPDDKRGRSIRDFFLPLTPKRALRMTTQEEIVDAYRD